MVRGGGIGIQFYGMGNDLVAGSGMFDGFGPVSRDGPLTFLRASLVLFVHEDKVFTGDHPDRGISIMGGKARENELPRACAHREIDWSVLFPTTEEAWQCSSLIESLEYSDFLLVAGGCPHLISLFGIDWPSGHLSLLPSVLRA